MIYLEILNRKSRSWQTNPHGNEMPLYPLVSHHQIHYSLLLLAGSPVQLQALFLTASEGKPERRTPALRFPKRRYEYLHSRQISGKVLPAVAWFQGTASIHHPPKLTIALGLRFLQNGLTPNSKQVHSRNW